MGFIDKIFGKPIETLGIKDIEEFFSTPQEETSVLEFKSGDVQIDDIYKEVSALANTDGGLLIIGAPRESKPKGDLNGPKVSVGDLTYSKFKSKGWLLQKIASNISPAPIEIKAFEHASSKGKVFILDIQPSSTPPHQSTRDGRYYVRLDEQALPAPHGFVQALFQQRLQPDLGARLDIDFTTEVLTISVLNNAITPANKIGFMFDFINVSYAKRKSIIATQHDGLPKRARRRIVTSFHSENTSQVLVNPIKIARKFHLYRMPPLFIVFVGLWALNSKFTPVGWIIRTQSQTITPLIINNFHEDYLDDLIDSTFGHE